MAVTLESMVGKTLNEEELGMLRYRAWPLPSRPQGRFGMF